MTNRKGHTYSKKIYCSANLIDIVQLLKMSLQTFQHLTDASKEQKNNRALEKGQKKYILSPQKNFFIPQ